MKKTALLVAVEDYRDVGITRPKDGSAWLRDRDSARILLGSRCYSSPWGRLSSRRDWNNSGNRNDGIGFRIVVDLE